MHPVRCPRQIDSVFYNGLPFIFDCISRDNLAADNDIYVDDLHFRWGAMCIHHGRSSFNDWHRANCILHGSLPLNFSPPTKYFQVPGSC